MKITQAYKVMDDSNNPKIIFEGEFSVSWMTQIDGKTDEEIALHLGQELMIGIMKKLERKI
jgi:hypothetical protein